MDGEKEIKPTHRVVVKREVGDTHTKYIMSWDGAGTGSTLLEVENSKILEVVEVVSRGWNLNEYANVREFTQCASDAPLPTKPQVMNRDQVRFIARMVCSELLELIQTIADNNDDALGMLHDCVDHADMNRNYQKPADEIGIIAEQLDAAVDMIYYLNNNATKFGTDTWAGFMLAHRANMAKKFPDGKLHKREDGKVIKPPEWREPDMRALIERMMGPSDSQG